MSELQENICRFCGIRGKNYFSLFEKQCREMIESLIAIKVTCDEKISTFICPDCFENLTSAFKMQGSILEVEIEHWKTLPADFLIQNHQDILREIHEELSTKMHTDGHLNELIQKLETSLVTDPQITYACKICPKKFQISSEFLKHLQRHLKSSYVPNKKISDSDEASNANLMPVKQPTIIKHTCDICDQAFALRYMLYIHKKNRHTIWGPYVCEICGMNFKRDISLNIHKKFDHQVNERN